ncbi:MAG: GerMN domain-containing protein [Acidobacteriota bacterium]|nr:GerMN domain-containing protein [Acidobacteriota bacterium]
MKTLSKLSRRLAPWALGLGLGLGLALVYLGGEALSAAEDDVAVYQVDVSQSMTGEDLDAFLDFVRSNPGKDILLEPSDPLPVTPGPERRQQDEARAAEEAKRHDAKIAEGLASGLYTQDGPAPDCASLSEAANGEPAIFRLCENGVRPVPTALPTAPVESTRAAEERLTAYLQAVLTSPDATEAQLGLASSFSDASALDSVTLAEGGEVTVDFNFGISSQIGGLHPGLATHYMLEQLYRTLFQFRDVRKVTLTLDGSCRAFGDLFEGPCQELDRDLWELMTELNDEQVAYFTLKGGQ